DKHNGSHLFDSTEYRPTSLAIDNIIQCSGFEIFFNNQQGLSKFGDLIYDTGITAVGDFTGHLGEIIQGTGYFESFESGEFEGFSTGLTGTVFASGSLTGEIGFLDDGSSDSEYCVERTVTGYAENLSPIVYYAHH